MVHHHIYTHKEHLQRIALKPIYPNHPNIYIYYRPWNNPLTAHTLRFSPEPKSSFRLHKLGSRPNRTPQRHPISNHFGAPEPNTHDCILYNHFRFSPEHPRLSAGVSGVPLQAGLALENSLHDFPVSPADITQNRCMSPARAVFFTPTSDTNYAVCERCLFRLKKHMKSS